MIPRWIQILLSVILVNCVWITAYNAGYKSAMHDFGKALNDAARIIRDQPEADHED